MTLEAGFDRTYVSLVERGVRSSTIRAVVTLAQVLNVVPSAVVRRMENLLAMDKPQRGHPNPTA